MLDTISQHTIGAGGLPVKSGRASNLDWGNARRLVIVICPDPG